MRKNSIVYLFALLLIAVQPLQAQCAMCRAALESSEGSGQAEAVNNGIVYLMIFPYLLVALVGYAVYRLRTKKSNTETAKG